MNIPFPLVRGTRREWNNSDDKRDEFQPRPRFPRIFHSFAAFSMDGFGNAIPWRCDGSDGRVNTREKFLTLIWINDNSANQGYGAAVTGMIAIPRTAER
jgi:hypothetical protein